MALRKHLIASLAMAALAIPAASASFVAFTAAPAFAKGGKGGGGKGGGGKSRGSEDRGSRGKSGKSGSGFGRSGQGGVAKGNRGQGNGNGNGNGGARGQAARSATAPVTTETAPLRPNELGSMNGAMNANVNAVLAHIRNGNTNGPVGALAGLAVADHAATGAQDVIDQAARHEALDDALAQAGYDTLADYQAAVEAGDIDPVPAIEDASTALGEAAAEDPPTEEDIAEAEAALMALGDAEANVFDAWNKSDAATEAEKTALLDALRERLAAESEAIDAAIGSTGTATEDDAGTETSPDGGTEGTPEDVGDDEPEALDPEIEAMLDNLKF